MALPTGGDYDLDAGLSGLLFRQELNPILEAILSQNASASLPPQTFPFMFRADQSGSPNELQVRNPSDNAFLKWAEITDSAVKLFSEGGGVPSLGVAQTFTEAQTVDISGSAGLFSVGSDVNSGVVARIPLFGHNSSAANTTGVNLVCRLVVNTAGSEDFTFEIEVLRGGAISTVATLGNLTDFRRSGGGGTLDADIVRQDGITLDTLLSESAGKFADANDFSGDRAVTQADEGALIRFNGSANQTITLPNLEEKSVVSFVNDSGGLGDLSFVSDTSPNDVEIRTTRTTLPGIAGQSPICSVIWWLSDGSRVNIRGNNV